MVLCLYSLEIVIYTRTTGWSIQKLLHYVTKHLNLQTISGRKKERKGEEKYGKKGKEETQLETKANG
jgi:hypothetical protein